VTGASGIWVTLGLVLALYAALGVASILVLRSMARRWREGESLDEDIPYGPGEGAPAPVAGGSE
jgi:cytochrome d ubiquinol oxidase subunit I